MKALVCEAYGPIDTLVVKDIPSPAPGPKQVLVKVEAASVNFPDALMVQGLYQVKPPLPFTPGAEIAGVVTAVGAEVTQCKPGDRVIALTSTGGFAEECLAEAHRVLPLPAGMDFDYGAALVLTYCTSLHALKDCGHLQPGETLVVLGAAGGVGISAIEIGKAMGARVIAAASTADKLDLCRRVGADETVNYSTENLKDRINELTGGKGADVVYDPVGGPYTEPALRATGRDGRLLVVGFTAGIPRIPTNLVLLKVCQIVGVDWRDFTEQQPQRNAANVDELVRMWRAGQLRPRISQTFPLARAPEAIAQLSARGAMGKLVIEIG